MLRQFRQAIHKIGASDRPLMKAIANIIRFPAKVTQYQLLTIQKPAWVVDLVRSVHREHEFTMWPYELTLLFLLASSARRLRGDFAEVGVYKGSSAKLLCEAKGEVALHLFDTFQGLPAFGSTDDVALSERQYAESLPNVRAYLRKYTNVHFYEGLFPHTATPVGNRQFSFVHLDLDLYQSTLESLKFFYPRMRPGGMIVSHDYSTLSSVREAFDEFFAEKPELVLELPTSQCLVVKG